MEVRIPKALLVALALLVVGGGLGVAGYLIGKGSGDEVDEDQIREEAFADGKQAGQDEGYDRGYDAGLVDGKRKAKPTLTYDQGYSDGGKDAMGVGDFEWQTGVGYIVDVDEGRYGVPYVVSGQYQMTPGEECTVPSAGDIRCGPND
jgi:hypothetical protein